MKIVAFMQNPWFKPGTDEKWIIEYRDNQDFHRRVLSMSMSGKRLEAAFGDLFKEIHWDNSNWRAADQASGKMEADYEHIERVIDREKPNLVICFGKVAWEAVRQFDPPVPIWECHHPNARGRTQEDLNKFAEMVSDYKKAYESGKHDNHIRTAGNG